MGRVKHGKKRYTDQARQMRGKHKSRRRGVNHKPKTSETSQGFFRAPGKKPKN